MESSPVRISVILVNYKNVVLTEKCIQSILLSNPQTSFEIIVVDNHSEDGSTETLRSQFPEITVLDSGKNGGFAFGNNIGVKLARGKYLLLLNNDTEVKTGMLDALYDFSERNPNVGMVGCKALDRNGEELPINHRYENGKRIWLQTHIKPLLERMGLQRRLVKRIERRENSEKAFLPAQWIAGSAMFIERELYIRVDGLDENYFMYMEDEDLCRRLHNAGYKVGIIPFVGYVHYCGGSTIPSYFLTKEYLKSRMVFFMRYESQGFSRIRKQLYRQIPVVNVNLSKNEITKMQYELNEFAQSELKQKAQNVRGIKSE